MDINFQTTTSPVFKFTTNEQRKTRILSANKTTKRKWGGKVPVDSNQNPNLNPHHNRVVVTSRDQLKEIKKKFGVGSSEYNAGLNDLCAHRKKKKREKVKSWAEH